MIKECEIQAADCLKTVGLRNWAGMIVCESCFQLEQAAQKANNTPEKQNERVNTMNAALKVAHSIDTSIQVRTDLFNAATVAIVDIKKTIDEDDTITNKPYALAQALQARFEHFKKVVFDAQETIVEAGNNQRAIHTYLNNLASQLRAEEREKLKLADINYKPNEPKVVKPRTISTSGTKSNKLDKKELKKVAAELGVSEFTLQMVVVSQGLSIEQAANKLRKAVAESKSESN